MNAARFLVLLFALSSLILPFQNCGQLSPIPSQSSSIVSDGITDNSNNEEDINGDPIDLPDENAPLSVSALDSAALDNGDMVVAIVLNKPDDEDITIAWDAKSDTAIEGVHFNSGDEETVIPAGETMVLARIPLLRSDNVEVRFNLNIVSVSKGELVRDSATVAISNQAVPTNLAGNWTAISDVNAPLGRDRCHAIWSGTEMLVWGGRGLGNAFGANGARYNPQTNTWTAMSTVGAPIRFPEEFSDGRHFSFWTGKKALYFGGEFQDRSLFIYDPENDSWQAASTNGAPTTYAWSMEWTGDELVAWNGADQTGAIYNVATDTWRAMNTAGAPAGQIRQTTAVFGSKVVFWGDFENNIGGIYDLSNDTWTLIPEAPGVVPLSGQSAIATATHLIIWGGDQPGGLPPVNTGYKFDIANQTWTAISTDGAPVGRYRHRAVWTGQKMIIFGGWFRFPVASGGTIPVSRNDGGIYDPVADTWEPLVGDPGMTPTAYQPMVWAGNALITWSGHFSRQFGDGAATTNSTPIGGGVYR